ncbi:MAG TPA: endolytic transglycosylase MltG [Flavipsychrobacter sp.]|nr:endolytic transglycosylase MltG [Flavipsychrobacter sp.]
MSSAKQSKKRKHKKAWPLWPISILIAIVLFVAFKVFGPNTGNFTKGEYLYIHTGSSYKDVADALHTGGFIKDFKSFNILAKEAHYPEHIHPGKYKINPGMSNYNIIRLLHSGKQTPVKLVINKLRTQQEFIRLIGENLEADSMVMQQMFHDPVYLAQFGLDTNTVMCAIMPDTYQFFWNTTADKAFRKIENNYTKFWNNERVQQAEQIKLTPQQVVIIASIIEEETNKNDEKPDIASVYLNRFHKGIKLQADPTIKFAIGDFSIRRITGNYLQFASPYNTYLYSGLPPGPICTPSVSSIEAVLNAPKTDYIYFCAKEDFSGYHRFAATYNEQLKNARLYQQALDAKGIH